MFFSGLMGFVAATARLILFKGDEF
ncbi:uncharacterized protein METZ01_LOCUS35193 [marine metagenome]|uniref:Uncharacterized protein n=1 Tax=marine metagenome TaxID=408172 RepID=A0A381QUT5_9ZZZZ